MWIGMQKELSFEEKLLAAGYNFDQECYRNQVGPLILRWWKDGYWKSNVFLVTANGNELIFTFTFYEYEDRPIATLEASILEFYKTLHGALPRKE